MCMDFSMPCSCGKREASFHFNNDIMPPEVISRLYCPECSGDIAFDPEKMVQDNGWAIEYDMDVVRFSAHRLPRRHLPAALSPEMLFDEGYATWRGVYPGDHEDNVRERSEIIKLAKTDPRGYLEKIRSWSTQRMNRLKEEGWRKANEERI